MLPELNPVKFQESVSSGFRRLSNFRDARVMHIKAYAGPYYDKRKGAIGKEPLNLIFNSIRVLVPHLVTNFPKHTVHTPYMHYREYAWMLGQALDQNAKDINLRDTYRRWIVDALFLMGITKTGLASTGSYAAWGDRYVDPGEIYTQTVDFDNFVMDPNTRGDMREADYFGDRIVVPRKKLLESGLYDNEMVERLPSLSDMQDRKRASSLSRNSVGLGRTSMHDEVEIVECWVPSLNATVTVPGCQSARLPRFLRTEDYVGDPEGPYTFLSFTPPVPGNPLPISMVGIWYDLHVMANNMAVKVMDQADRQKSVVAYKPSGADDAVALQDAGDGEAVRVDDPDAVNVLNFGGQAQSNDMHLMSLMQWFNMMAANPQATGGQDLRADSATEAGILAQNANVGLNDMKDRIYIAAASEARKRLFYIHTDPLIQMPLVRREQGTGGPQEVQVFLTPEQQRGDFIDFALEIQPESMDRVDRQTRLAQAMDFAVRLLPSATAAALQLAQMGQPFNLPTYLGRMAREAGIDWLDEVFFDPAFEARINMMQMGPQPSKGQAGPPAGPPIDFGALQNGQPGSVMGAPVSAETQFRQDAQAGAAQSQREMQGVMSPGTAN